MRRTIRLRESELKRMISESVKRILMEERLPNGGEYDQTYGGMTSPGGRYFDLRKTRPFDLEKTKGQGQINEFEDDLGFDDDAMDDEFPDSSDRINGLPKYPFDDDDDDDEPYSGYDMLDPY